MKTYKLFFSIVLTFVSISAVAQLKVDSDGKVNLGSTSSYNYGRLNIGLDGNNNGLAFFNGTGTPFYMYRASDLLYMTRGGVGIRKGLKMTNDGRIVLGEHNDGWSSTGQGHFAIFTEQRIPSFSIFNKGLDNYGDVLRSYAYSPVATLFAGWYINEATGAWDKNFAVLANGDIYSRGQLLLSDETAKKNIETIDSPLQKVLKLRGVSYNFKSDELLKDKQFNATEQFLVGEKSVQITQELFNTIKAESNRKHIGVIAQEVEVIVPEVVRTTFDGKKAVSYVDLIGLLIEAVKEQQVQIEDLKKQISPTTIKKNAQQEEDYTADISSIVMGNSVLYQNIPNPFSISSEIRYFLSENIKKANLYIYDMQGKQIKNIANLAHGEGSVVINGYELIPGMYIYTLIADGKEIDTKRMILTD